MADPKLLAILRRGAKAWNGMRSREGHNLPAPNLADAHLAGADLNRARFSGANLTGANLTHAGLSSTDLFNAIGLEQGQIDRAIGNEQTILPPGLTHPPQWVGPTFKHSEPAELPDAEAETEAAATVGPPRAHLEMGQGQIHTPDRTIAPETGAAPRRHAVVVGLVATDPAGSRMFVLTLRDYVATARTEADRLDNVAPDEAREIRSYLDRLDAAFADLVDIIDRLKSEKAGVEQDLERARAKIADLERGTSWRRIRETFDKTLGATAAAGLCTVISAGVTLLASEAAPEALELAKRVMAALAGPK